MTAIIALAVLMAIGAIVAAALGVAACMLSSQISAEEGEQ